MSYEKVKSIKIDEKNKKVFLNGASNNVRPLNYTREEYPYFSKILKEEGKGAVEIALLQGYESGNLQGGSNKYTKALKVLFYVLKNEYHKFNWRTNWDEYRKLRETEEGKKEFEELLKKALNYKFPKEKYIISKNYMGCPVYMKKCLTCAKWNYNKKDATKFDFKEEAEDSKKYFKESKEWEVLKYE
jgi:hypothetical protein